MALLLTYDVGAPCAGGNHISVTAHAGPLSFTKQADRFYWTVKPSDEEMESAVWTILRVMVRQLSAAGQTSAAIKTIIEAKIVDLTVVG